MSVFYARRLWSSSSTWPRVVGPFISEVASHAVDISPELRLLVTSSSVFLQSQEEHKAWPRGIFAAELWN